MSMPQFIALGDKLFHPDRVVALEAPRPARVLLDTGEWIDCPGGTLEQLEQIAQGYPVRSSSLGPINRLASAISNKSDSGT